MWRQEQRCRMSLLGSRHPALCCILLFFLLLGRVSATTIIATVGRDVTLPCNYDAQYYGTLSVCWGRGDIPNSGCANEVLRTDGSSVTSRASERYVLIGDLGQGDASLTVRNVVEGDSGTYGCRVDIPGWFNDLKFHVTLTVTAGPPNPVTIESREVKDRTVTVRWAPAFDGGRPITMYWLDQKDKEASWDSAVRTEISNPKLIQVTLMDLRPFKTYSLRMFARNSVGVSASSNVITVTTKEAAPEGAPLDMDLEALSPNTIRVTWKPPRADLRNGVLRSYSISYREFDPVSQQFKQWHHRSVAATRDVESIVLNNLKPSAMYGVLIQAKTNAGIGPPTTAPFCSTLDEVHTTTTATLTTATTASSSSAATVWIEEATSTAVPKTTTAETVPVFTVWEESTTMVPDVLTPNPLAPPDPPVVKLKEVKDHTISLFWTPGFEGESPITGFYLEYKAANASWDYIKTVVDFGANETEATIIEIHPSTYNIRMFARNSLGTSKASNVLTITTGDTGHQWNNVSTTTSADTHAAVNAEESQSGHLAAIIVAVVLVVLTVALVTTWHFRRMRLKNGSLNIWLSNGALRYRGSESLQEL
ncbi:protein sidekick-1-like [Mugil cephalus]|uniref:protein sidekick-1-like n=1 Tax=Mugil cephalus TaxID=48193 RepID=UPI001FB5D2C2|nr:protein sidekick-1-like [Mugil cephalus]